MEMKQRILGNFESYEELLKTMVILNLRRMPSDRVPPDLTGK